MLLLKNRYISGFILLVWIFAFKANGQLYPNSNYHVYNSLLINPAVAGSDNALNTSLYYRTQWTGVEGAPKNLTFDLHSPIHHNKMGLGIIVNTESYGIQNNTNFNASYAYRIKFRRAYFNIGLAVNASLISQSWNEVITAEPEDIEYSDNREFLPNFAFGVLYKSKTFYAGASVPQILLYEWNSEENKYSAEHKFMEYNYVLYGGVQIKLGNQVYFKPSLISRYFAYSDWLIDFNPQFTFYNKVGLGLIIRSNNTYVPMLDVHLNKQVSFSYSYGFQAGNKSLNQGASHELMLKYVFKYEKEVSSQR